MIFLSHNSKDKPIVRQIAQRLEKVFGQENIFYDEWSIQPGDSIIGKMNTGIEKCKYFFLFISKNSLQSPMVTLEWQSALMKRTQQQIKFIPVRLDETEVPAIIKHLLYIELYQQDFEVAIRQIIDVVSENNTFQPNTQFSNLLAETQLQGSDLVVEIKAGYYMEPHSRYLLVVDNDESDLDWMLPDFVVSTTGFNKNISFSDGVHNCILVDVDKATSPNFPVKVILKPKTGKKVNLLYVMHATSHKDFSSIPVKAA